VINVCKKTTTNLGALWTRVPQTHRIKMRARNHQKTKKYEEKKEKNLTGVNPDSALAPRSNAEKKCGKESLLAGGQEVPR